LKNGKTDGKRKIRVITQNNNNLVALARKRKTLSVVTVAEKEKRANEIADRDGDIIEYIMQDDRERRKMVEIRENFGDFEEEQLEGEEPPENETTKNRKIRWKRQAELEEQRQRQRRLRENDDYEENILLPDMNETDPNLANDMNNINNY
jgi:hypothetical protein